VPLEKAIGGPIKVLVVVLFGLWSERAPLALGRSGLNPGPSTASALGNGDPKHVLAILGRPLAATVAAPTRFLCHYSLLWLTVYGGPVSFIKLM